MTRVYHFLKYLGQLNYYKGVDRLTIVDWLYRYRLSIQTAWALAGTICKIKNER